MSCLDEADVLGILPEALPADVEAVLADQAPAVAADPAAGASSQAQSSVLQVGQLQAAATGS